MLDKSDRDLPAVPVRDTTTAHQSGSSTPLRPSSQWGKALQEKSPTSLDQEPDTPVVAVSAVPARESSLSFNRASPPHIEEDYDRYRNMLSKSATRSQKGDSNTLHDAGKEDQVPVSMTDQQKASREYGRRQIQATHGNDLNMQALSIADDGTCIGRASTQPIPMNQKTSNPRSSTDPVANNRNATTRKALPFMPQDKSSPGDHTLSHKPSNTDLPKLNQHPSPSTISINQNHTTSISPRPDPLARLPPSFNPTNTTDTTVDTTVAPAVTHQTLHTQRTEIVQEVITRDIHVHHYYHYIQPLKVVEVQPARHFRLDSHGEKVAIAAPEDWEMPGELSVRRAPDFLSSGDGRSSAVVDGEGASADRGPRGVELGWIRRDYIVDEENPRGRMLSAEELEQDREREREREKGDM